MLKKYNDCKTIFALKMITGKWKPYVIYMLYMGEARYIDIWRQIPRVSKKILSENLQQLIENGLVQKQTFNEAPPRVVYSLTSKGQSIAEICNLLDKWSHENI